SSVSSTGLCTTEVMNSAVCFALLYGLDMITSISLVERRCATYSTCLSPNSDRPTDATWCLSSALYWLSACRTKYTCIRCVFPIVHPHHDDVAFGQAFRPVVYIAHTAQCSMVGAGSQPPSADSLTLRQASLARPAAPWMPNSDHCARPVACAPTVLPPRAHCTWAM